MATTLVRIVTYLEGLLTIKSFRVVFQGHMTNKKNITTLPECIWSPDLAG